MNNKDEKTFADLFSSSTSETEENKPEENKTFDTIFKSENQEELNSTEVKEPEKNKSTITFDNIADSLSSEEEISTVKTDIFATTVTEQKQEEQSDTTIEQEETNTIMNNPFFSREEENKPTTTVETSEKAIETAKEKQKETSIFEENQPKENSEEETKVSSEPNTENQELENPFFEDKASDLETSSPNPFFADNKEESEVKEEPVDSANPFFINPNNEEEPLKESIETEPKSALVDNTNPFFNEESVPVIDLKLPEASNETIDTTPKEEVNPFFQKDSSPVETKQPLIEETKTPEVKKEDDIPKSTSPFFEEEKKEETSNPFFQGQLNLVENKQHNNPIGNVDVAKSKHFNVKIVKKKESAFKFILGVFSYAIFIFLLLIGITLLIYVLDTKIRAAKGDYSAPTFNAYVVLTGSMLPEIEVNDVVVTKKVEASTLQEGDIITFASADSRFQGTIITHRIIKKNPPDGTNGYTFQTRGDNNNVADSALVPEANIYGKVILKIPKLGYLQEFLASDGGWIIVILIPCLTVMSYDIVKLVKGLKRKKYKNIKVQK